MNTKITVIGTVHTEGGECNSDELIKIIQKIAPAVIFCEASPEIFPAMLKAVESFNTPEIKVLRRIIEEESIDVVPVDIHEDPFDGRLEAMHALFKNKIREYFCATQIHADETYRLGFPYLNSKDSDKIHNDKSSMEMAFISRSNNSQLSQIHLDWLQWNDKRENHWINRIYDYFEWNEISTAVFLVGAAHRTRLMKKIKNIPVSERLILDWDFFPFNNSK